MKAGVEKNLELRKKEVCFNPNFAAEIVERISNTT